MVSGVCGTERGFAVPAPRPARTAAGRLVAVLLLILGTLGIGVVGAGPAFAHAQLLSTDPAAGAHLTNPPDHVSLTFGEAVSFVPDGFRLLDHTGSDLTLGDPQESGTKVTVAVPGKLADGAYVFSWRVVSADTHPVAGAIPFTVGNAASGPAPAISVGGGAPGSTQPLAAVNRWVGYVGAIGSVGTLFFVLLCWPAGRRDRFVRLVGVAGTALVAITAVVGLPLQASLADGVPVHKVFSGGAVRAVLHSTFGHAAIARLVLAVLLAVLLSAPRRLPGVDGVCAAVGVALLACFSWAGHASVSDVPALTVADDVIHLVCVVTWLGGLFLLATRLLPAPWPGLEVVLARWSRTAMWAVGLLVVTGVIQAWRELRSVHALAASDYGHWIIAKTCGLVLLVLLGNLGRSRVQAWARSGIGTTPAGASLGAMRAADPAPPVLGRLRQSVAAELVIAAVVLVFSALLVVSDPHVESSSAGMSGMPGMSMAAGSVSGSVTLPTGPVATISISPAMAGSPTINIVTASAGGGSLDPVEVDATAALPARGIEPIPLTLTRTSAGHYVVNGAPLGFPGTWTITVTVRTSDIDSGVGTVNLVLH